MTLENMLQSSSNARVESIKAPVNINIGPDASNAHDYSTPIQTEPEASLQPLIGEEVDSDYGDFSPGEEEIISSLLAEVVQSEIFGDEPLVVTDIEDYEEPKGVRLPKVLGIEPSPQSWLPRTLVQVHRQRMRASEALQVEKAENREGGGDGERGCLPLAEKHTEAAEDDKRSPLERFRRPPKKALSVTDLVSPAWCELQYFYTLAKHGRKKRTPAMRQGSSIHKALENEVHTTVAIDITTKEDSWGLRIWNIIQGLRTLRDIGKTRELEVWGLIGGEIVNGVVDELSYSCPDPKLEAETEERYANAKSTRNALPEYQKSITDYLLAGEGQKMSNIADQMSASDSQKAVSPPPTSNQPREKLIYVTDVKTRSSKRLPSGSSIRPAIIQLHLYHHMLENLAQDNFPLDLLARRYGLDTKATFSDAFIAQVGSLNQDFFDAASEQLGVVEAKAAASQIASSQDSTELLLKHNNLDSLWGLMIEQFQETLIMRPKYSVTNTPSSTPQSIVEKPTFATRLSPILTAKYLSAMTSEVLGSKSVLFDATLLRTYLEDGLAWWRGEREAKGVELQEAWKCRSCDFRDDCSWIHERDAAAVAEVNARKKMREAAGAEPLAAKSKV